jgi:hypothetical protein
VVELGLRRCVMAARHGYLCSADYRDVVETLKDWGALRPIVSVQ